MEVTTADLQTASEKMGAYNLRSRGGSKADDGEQALARKSGTIMAAQDDLMKAIDGSRKLKGEDSPALTPGVNTPLSMSPTPPADGSLANFGMVMAGVYRSAWPTSEGFDFMENLKLATIVTLVDKDDSDTEYAKFVAKNGITQHVFDIKGTKKQSIPAETMRDVLNVVLDKSNHPVLVHCNRGRHRTGCVIGVIRKLYGWDLATTLAEYHSFSAPKPRDADINYLTKVETANLIASPRQLGPAQQHRQGSFQRILTFALFGTLIWFVTLYRIAYVTGDLG